MKAQVVEVIIMGKSVKVEIKPGHFGPATYTIFGKRASIFLFRKIESEWTQVYGIPFSEEVFNATIEALENIYIG